MTQTIAQLSQQAQTYPILLLADITSFEDNAQLHLSQMACSYGGNSYTAQILSVSGFDQSLESSPIGIMGIPDITLILGDANGSMTAWDNAHYFKGSRITVRLVFYNPVTGSVISSDSRVIFQGICNAPDESNPTTLTLSAFSRFNSEYLLLPIPRISVFSQTTFPGDGAQDCDDANATGSGPANSASAGYQWFHAALTTSGGVQVPAGGAKDAFLSYLTCGYGPLRGSSGWGGINPLGNFLVATASATAGLCNSTNIGNSSGGYTAGALVNHIVAIVSGTGAGQQRRISANTTTQITIANKWKTIPDGTSEFCVLYGFCGKDALSCQARGMYSQDSASRPTQRFQGISFVPYDPKTKVTINPDQAKFNQPIPLIYGTVTIQPVELFSLTGNYNAQMTHAQYLVGIGLCSNLTNFLIGGTIVPYSTQSDYNSVGLTGEPTKGLWTYQPGELGNCFTDAFFGRSDVDGLGHDDPKSGMCVIFTLFPVQFAQNVPGSAPIQVQVTGVPVWSCDYRGNFSSTPVASGNPAWIILDLLMRSGWKYSEINLPSFYAFSVYASQTIDIFISSTQTTSAERFAFGFYIQQQQPASEILRAVMAGCHAILSYDTVGLLRIDCENKLPDTTLNAGVSAGTQWVTVEDGAGITIGSVLTVGTGADSEQITVTNVQLSGGGADFQIYANFANPHLGGEAVFADTAYSFDLSSILQDGQKNPTLKRTSLKTASTPNEYVGNFEDSERAYVSDTVDLINTQEANAFGAPVIGNLQSLGFQTVDAATRIAQLALYKSHGRRDSANNIISRGNLFADLSSSVKAIGASIGSIVDVTYAKEGWTGKYFRVVKITPTQDSMFPYWKIKLTLREHDDGWYDDINGNIPPTPGKILPPPPPIASPNSLPFPPLPILR